MVIFTTFAIVDRAQAKQTRLARKTLNICLMCKYSNYSRDGKEKKNKTSTGMSNSIGKGLRSRGRNSPTRPAMGMRLGHSEPHP